MPEEYNVPEKLAPSSQANRTACSVEPSESATARSGSGSRLGAGLWKDDEYEQAVGTM